MSIKNENLAKAYAESELLIELRRMALIERGRAYLYDVESDLHERNSNSMNSAIIAALEHKEKADMLDRICEAIMAGEF